MNNYPDKIDTTVAEAKQDAHQAVDKLREDARQAGAQLKQKAREATAQIKEHGLELATQEKQTVADSLGHFGTALRSAAGELHSKQERRVATATEKLADQIEVATQYLRDRELSHIYEDAQSYARQHPEVIFGVLFFSGLAIGRFLKASPYQPPYTAPYREESATVAVQEPYPETASATVNSVTSI